MAASSAVTATTSAQSAVLEQDDGAHPQRLRAIEDEAQLAQRG